MVNKFEAIVICDHQRNNLHISWDEEDGFVFLFTPDMNNTGNHYHLELTEDEAELLYSFLSKKLTELRGNGGDLTKVQKVLGNAPDAEPDSFDRI